MAGTPRRKSASVNSVKAAVLRSPRTLAIEETRVAAPAPDEVRVRVAAAGLCGTDYRIWTGDRPVAYPRVMGHEFVGRVEAVGADVTRVAPRSEEHTSELQSLTNLVCRLLLEKKK